MRSIVDHRTCRPRTIFPRRSAVKVVSLHIGRCRPSRPPARVSSSVTDGRHADVTVARRTWTGLFGSVVVSRPRLSRTSGPWRHLRDTLAAGDRYSRPDDRTLNQRPRAARSTGCDAVVVPRPVDKKPLYETTPRGSPRRSPTCTSPGRQRASCQVDQAASGQVKRFVIGRSKNAVLTQLWLAAPACTCCWPTSVRPAASRWTSRAAYPRRLQLNTGERRPVSKTSSPPRFATRPRPAAGSRWPGNLDRRLTDTSVIGSRLAGSTFVNL